MKEYQRLTVNNQYGDILYCGQYKNIANVAQGYKNMGNYPEGMTVEAIYEVLCRLFWFEEKYEELNEILHMISETTNIEEDK